MTKGATVATGCARGYALPRCCVRGRVSRAGSQEWCLEGGKVVGVRAMRSKVGVRGKVVRGQAVGGKVVRGRGVRGDLVRGKVVRGEVVRDGIGRRRHRMRRQRTRRTRVRRARQPRPRRQTKPQLPPGATRHAGRPSACSCCRGQRRQAVRPVRPAWSAASWAPVMDSRDGLPRWDDGRGGGRGQKRSAFSCRRASAGPRPEATPPPADPGPAPRPSCVAPPASPRQWLAPGA